LPSGLSFVAKGSDPRCKASGQVVTCIEPQSFTQTQYFLLRTKVGDDVGPAGANVSLWNSATVSTVSGTPGTSGVVVVTVNGP
jgi:hypothetical protein